MAEPPAIHLEGLRKAWGDTTAVADASLSVRQGEFVILLGPSGCGKSTTLRMIAGLEPPDAGRLRINGTDVTRQPPGRRGLSMVFQSYALFPHLTVADNIVFGLRSRRVPKAQRRRRLNHVARLVGLEELLQRKPAQLSGGQRQRVALARAVIAEHPICLMDEPLSNLDARLRAEMRREIRELQRRLGMTVVYVTHDQVEAMSMGDRVVLMDRGTIVQDDTPDALYSRPRTAFAATFVGSPPMNLLELADDGGASHLPGAPGTPVAPAGLAGCLLGVRPEDVGIAGADSAGIPAEIVDEEYLGADTIVRLRVGEQTLRSRLTGHRPGPAERHCRIHWPHEAAHLFDTGTGRRRDDAAVYGPGEKAPATAGDTPAVATSTQ
ncbi:ABC transporter ATP-binding protein [Aquisalimonas lutea]|uniref:ABC transporter ATP-binding protein n=1 Tax=Aquisalimonas lutea TaxID=1327750 RepID=UPI0025B41A1C|nr:ABC transporter ATP-binding protein [Aquisalimonas lutea]MDN3517289.1 ABC transporter ATP-binding protein [Aquisalimonas lutea]